MANVIYRNFYTMLLERMLQGPLGAATNVYLGLIHTYQEDANAHSTLSNMGGTIHFRGVTAVDLTVTGRTLHGASLQQTPAITALPCGVMLYEQVTAADADRKLICYWDTGGMFPLVPDGTALTFTFDPVNGILTL